MYVIARLDNMGRARDWLIDLMPNQGVINVTRDIAKARRFKSETDAWRVCEMAERNAPGNNWSVVLHQG